MKKIIAVSLILAIALSLCACGVPDGFTKTTYNAAKSAIKVVDAYLSDSKDAQTTVVELDELAVSVESEMSTITDATEQTNAMEISLTLRSFIYLINRSGGNLSDMDRFSIKSSRDTLERKISG